MQSQQSSWFALCGHCEETADQVLAGVADQVLAGVAEPLLIPDDLEVTAVLPSRRLPLTGAGVACLIEEVQEGEVREPREA